MATRTVRECMAYLAREIRYGSRFRYGLCKRKTREAYLIDSDGSPTAAVAWSRTRHRFHGLWIWGGLIWWTGGSDGDGHVAIMRWRKGHIRSVDYPRTGHWNNTTVAKLEEAWPRIRFAGTSLDIDGVTVRKMPRVARRWSHT
jgi:hypothetical protein